MKHIRRARQAMRLLWKCFGEGFYLGIGLAGLINVLNPEAIVIGGGAAGGWDLFVPEMVEQIRLRSYREPAERAKIIRCRMWR